MKSGERLPTLREMMKQWNCTVGTVQRAYQELASQGLVSSRAGQGTHVVGEAAREQDYPMRRATLIHRAEAFLLEVLTAGYSPTEVEDSVRQALDRWRVVTRERQAKNDQALRFSGSHDLAVAWMATHFDEISPGWALQLRFSGSLGGLMDLAAGKADLAGCHLWDEETNSYNLPFIRRLLPGKRVAVLELAVRHVGLIVQPGNPGQIGGLQDLMGGRVRFINRQTGSGTRVWLDASLHRLGISGSQIQGYSDEKMTHSDVALTIAEGQADAGLGLEGAAHDYGLDFIPLVQERYDLVLHSEDLDHPAVRALQFWLEQGPGRESLHELFGYDFSNAGAITWIGDGNT